MMQKLSAIFFAKLLRLTVISGMLCRAPSPEAKGTRIKCTAFLVWDDDDDSDPPESLSFGLNPKKGAAAINLYPRNVRWYMVFFLSLNIYIIKNKRTIERERERERERENDKIN